MRLPVITLQVGFSGFGFTTVLCRRVNLSMTTSTQWLSQRMDSQLAFVVNILGDDALQVDELEGYEVYREKTRCRLIMVSGKRDPIVVDWPHPTVTVAVRPASGSSAVIDCHKICQHTICTLTYLTHKIIESSRDSGLGRSFPWTVSQGVTLFLR